MIAVVVPVVAAGRGASWPVVRLGPAGASPISRVKRRAASSAAHAAGDSTGAPEPEPESRARKPPRESISDPGAAAKTGATEATGNPNDRGRPAPNCGITCDITCAMLGEMNCAICGEMTCAMFSEAKGDASGAPGRCPTTSPTATSANGASTAAGRVATAAAGAGTDFAATA